MKSTELVMAKLTYAGWSVAALCGLVAVVIFGWEPSQRVVAIAALVALMFAANARYWQIRTEDHDQREADRQEAEHHQQGAVGGLDHRQGRQT